jgi:hypothetical protein
MSVLFAIWFYRLNCNGGNSPVIPQGCGYMTQWLLFDNGDFSTLLYGLYLVYLGTAILALGWLFRKAEKNGENMDFHSRVEKLNEGLAEERGKEIQWHARTDIRHTREDEDPP